MCAAFLAGEWSRVGAEASWLSAASRYSRPSSSRRPCRSCDLHAAHDGVARCPAILPDIVVVSMLASFPPALLAHLPGLLWRSSMHILLSSVHSPYTIRWCLAIGQTAGACVCPTQSHLSDVNTLASPEAHIYMRIYPTPTRAPDPLCPYSTQSARTVRRAPAHPGAHMHVYAHTFTPHTCPRYVNLGGIFSC